MPDDRPTVAAPAILPLPPPALVALTTEPGYTGVAYTPPPPSILPSILRQVEEATAPLEPGEIALVGVADRKGGWNSAFVAKTTVGVEIDTWIGKSWAEGSELDYGVRVLYRRKIGGT